MKNSFFSRKVWTQGVTWAILEISNTTPSCRKPNNRRETGFFGLPRQIYCLISTKSGTIVYKTSLLLNVKKKTKKPRSSSKRIKANVHYVWWNKKSISRLRRMGMLIISYNQKYIQQLWTRKYGFGCFPILRPNVDNFQIKSQTTPLEPIHANSDVTICTNNDRSLEIHTER